MATNNRKLIILLLLSLGCLRATGQTVRAQPPEQPPASPMPELWQPDPKHPIYMAASIFNRQDREQLHAAIESVVGRSHEPEALELAREELRLIRGDFNISIDNIKVELQGEPAVATRATATVVLTLHNRWVSLRQTEKVTLGRADDRDALSRWRIIPDDPIVIFADDGAGLLQRLATCLTQPRAFILESRKRAAVRNIKALILGLRQFVIDYEGNFELNARDFRKKLQPYLASDTIFTAPTDPPGTISYTFNPNLEGKAAIDLDAAKTVIIYETRNGELNYAYEGKALVGFVDGHTEFITPEQVPLLRWKP